MNVQIYQEIFLTNVIKNQKKMSKKLLLKKIQTKLSQLSEQKIKDPDSGVKNDPGGNLGGVGVSFSDDPFDLLQQDILPMGVSTLDEFDGPYVWRVTAVTPNFDYNGTEAGLQLSQNNLNSGGNCDTGNNVTNNDKYPFKQKGRINENAKLNKDFRRKMFKFVRNLY